MVFLYTVCNKRSTDKDIYNDMLYFSQINSIWRAGDVSNSKIYPGHILPKYYIGCPDCLFNYIISISCLNGRGISVVFGSLTLTVNIGTILQDRSVMDRSCACGDTKQQNHHHHHHHHCYSALFSSCSYLVNHSNASEQPL